MPPAESILVIGIVEVHPGAGSVNVNANRHLVAGHVFTRYVQ